MGRCGWVVSLGSKAAGDEREQLREVLRLRDLELELQTDALTEAQAEIECLHAALQRAREETPLACLTLDEEGLMCGGNLRAARLFGPLPDVPPRPLTEHLDRSAWARLLPLLLVVFQVGQHGVNPNRQIRQFVVPSCRYSTGKIVAIDLAYLTAQLCQTRQSKSL